MTYRLFLDDFRNPVDCAHYMRGVDLKIYHEEWKIVRSYTEFCKTLQRHGLPVFISFDHDLAEGHYHENILEDGKLNYESEDFRNPEYRTGYHCAQWLVEYCMTHNLSLPEYIVHSMNPVGKENIKGLLEGFKNFHSHNSDSQNPGT